MRFSFAVIIALATFLSANVLALPVPNDKILVKTDGFLHFDQFRNRPVTSVSDKINRHQRPAKPVRWTRELEETDLNSRAFPGHNEDPHRLRQRYKRVLTETPAPVERHLTRAQRIVAQARGERAQPVKRILVEREESELEAREHGDQTGVSTGTSSSTEARIARIKALLHRIRLRWEKKGKARKAAAAAAAKKHSGRKVSRAARLKDAESHRHSRENAAHELEGKGKSTAGLRF